MGDVIYITVFMVGLYAIASLLSTEPARQSRPTDEREGEWYQITEDQRN